jgi:xanthine dehydrogenase molybdenum-binding subunit
VSDPYENFALETFMDKIAVTIGMDPLELRRKNMVRSGDPLDGGLTLSSCGLEECIQKGAERIGWSARKSPASQGPKKRGMGMAITTRTGGSDISSAVIKLESDGSIHLLTGATDIGTGSRTTLAQIAAEELGVEPGDITIITSDTGSTPYTRGAWASSIALSAGKAVQTAAQDARKKLFDLAAPLLKVKPEELALQDRHVVVAADPSKKVPMAQVVRQVQTVIGTATTNQPARPLVARGFAAHFAEVEVDAETGKISVLRFVAAHDVGKALNPKVVENQIEGGVIQGIALALTEQLIWDRAAGRPVNANLIDFKVPTIMETPPIETILVEPGEPLGPYGAKGAGETPIQAPIAAIANAVYNATGKWMRELPMTPKRVLANL